MPLSHASWVTLADTDAPWGSVSWSVCTGKLDLLMAEAPSRPLFNGSDSKMCLGVKRVLQKH